MIKKITTKEFIGFKKAHFSELFQGIDQNNMYNRAFFNLDLKRYKEILSVFSQVCDFHTMRSSEAAKIKLKALNDLIREK